MIHENENAANLHTGLKRREFMAILAGCTAGLMVPNLFHGEGKIAAATASPSDRLGKLLPLRKLGSSGPTVTNLGVGGDHVGNASEKDAQAIIEKPWRRGCASSTTPPCTAMEEQRNAMENSSLPSTGTLPSS